MISENDILLTKETFFFESTKYFNVFFIKSIKNKLEVLGILGFLGVLGILWRLGELGFLDKKDARAFLPEHPDILSLQMKDLLRPIT